MTPLQTRILERLKQGPLDTNDPEFTSPGVVKVSICHLRAQGYNITTIRGGRHHRAGRYILEPDQ